MGQGINCEADWFFSHVLGQQHRCPMGKEGNRLLLKEYIYIFNVTACVPNNDLDVSLPKKKKEKIEEEETFPEHLHLELSALK